MEQNYYPQGGQFQEPLPNSTAILVLGILSIPLCCICGSGIVTAIIALVMSGTAKKQYAANPQAYTQQSYNNMNAGRICAIVGLAFCALYLLYNIVVFIVYGAAAIMNPEILRK